MRATSRGEGSRALDDEPFSPHGSVCVLRLAGVRRAPPRYPARAAQDRRHDVRWLRRGGLRARLADVSVSVMTFENILIEREGAVAVLTINRPKVLNAL